MKSLHGYLFFQFQQFWLNLRKFAFINRTIFETFFILLYALEQAGLIWFAFNAKDIMSLTYFVSIFAIIVLTTFALHKLVMESRIKLLEIELNNLFMDKTELDIKNKDIINKYNELIQLYYEQTKSLNISKNNKKEKRVK